MLTTLTREQILEMPAGRELDALVAEHVIGYIRMKDTNGDVELIESRMRDYMAKRFKSVQSTEPLTLIDVPKYSTDIAAAWTVVEKSGCFQLFTCDAGYGFKLYTTPEKGDELVAEAFAETAPLAICRAALIATLDTKEKEG